MRGRSRKQRRQKLQELWTKNLKGGGNMERKHFKVRSLVLDVRSMEEHDELAYRKLRKLLSFPRLKDFKEIASSLERAIWRAVKKHQLPKEYATLLWYGLRDFPFSYLNLRWLEKDGVFLSHEDSEGYLTLVWVGSPKKAPKTSKIKKAFKSYLC